MSEFWPEGHDPAVLGEFLHNLLGAPRHEGPPFVHTLKLPESEEEMRADPSGTPQYSLSEEEAGAGGQ